MPRRRVTANRGTGALGPRQGNIALTCADDRTSTAKCSSLGITAQSFNSIGVDSFEVVDLSSEIRSTNDCVRNP